MVSVVHKGPEYKVENLSNKKLEVMQTKIKNKCKLPVGEQSIPDQSTLSFTGMID